MSLAVCRNISVAQLARQNSQKESKFRKQHNIGPGETIQDCRPLNLSPTAYKKAESSFPPLQKGAKPPRPRHYIYDTKHPKREHAAGPQKPKTPQRTRGGNVIN